MHEEDLRTPELEGTFGFVRVANVLNRSYFAEATLRGLVDAVVGRVADGGFVFVVRTHEDDSNHGTYFERRASSMVEVARIGAGSEVSRSFGEQCSRDSGIVQAGADHARDFATTAYLDRRRGLQRIVAGRMRYGRQRGRACHFEPAPWRRDHAAIDDRVEAGRGDGT